MTTIISQIQDKIVEYANEIQSLKAVYTSPTFELGRQLPALTIMYNGFAQAPFTQTTWLLEYDFEFTLYLPFEGRNTDRLWESMQAITLKVLETFRDDAHWQLGGLVIWSIIDRGRPIVDVPSNPEGKPKWIGHTFSMQVKVEES
jgi:hypothetical protein